MTTKNRSMDLEDMKQDLDFIFPVISGKVSMAINRMMYRNFRKVGLDITPEQWTVLTFLWGEDGVTQQKLCNATFKDKPSMTRLIDNLVKQDFVYREASADDRRSNFIFLTERGKAIKAKAQSAVLKTTKSALEGVSEDEYAIIRHIMKIVFGNIQEALDKE